MDKLHLKTRGLRRLLALMLAPLLTFFFLGAAPAHAADTVTFDGSPGTAAPPAMLGEYPMVAAPTDTREIWESVTTVPMANGNLTLSSPAYHLRIGDSWGSWSHGYTGDVYGFFGLASVTMTLPDGTGAFYFYAQPNNYADFTFTATTDDGTTSGPLTVSGTAGARYFGFYAPLGVTIVSVTITANDPSGFAVGEFATAKAPLGGAPRGGDWVLAPISAVDPAVDKGNFSDGNGDGWAVYMVSPGSDKHGGVIWKDNTTPF